MEPRPATPATPATPEQLALLLVDAVSDYAIFHLDPEGNVRTWNAGARRLKGYTAEEIIGQHFSRFYTPEDLARNHPANELQVARAVGRYEEEGWRVRKDGSHFWASVLITSLYVGDELIGFAKVTRDLTERREGEERLRQSNQELERFASTAAHDLVEPLHTLIGLGDLLEHRHAEALGEDGRELVMHMRNSADRLRARVDALLTYARSSQRKLDVRPVSVGEALGHVLDHLRVPIAEAGATIDYEPRALPTVEADPRMLEIVLQNVISNSVKFRRPDADPAVTVRAEPVAIGWRIVIADNGQGIPPDERERVFSFFHRLHLADEVPGSGLGLPLVRRIVERHGGEAGIEDAPGGGTRLWITLPSPTAP